MAEEVDKPTTFYCMTIGRDVITKRKDGSKVCFWNINRRCTANNENNLCNQQIPPAIITRIG